jgi:spore coat-associated protein N
MTDMAAANTGAGATARRPLIKRPKRTLGALALGLVALGVAVGSGADFSAQTANPSNTFSAGSLSMDNSKDGAAILSATNMQPGGEPQTGVVDIKNTGSIDGDFTVTRDQLAAGPFAGKVMVTVVDCGQFTTASGPYGPVPVTPTCGDGDDQQKYAGTLADQDAPVELGAYGPGDQHRYQFGATLAAAADDESEGGASSARYVFDAVQTR